MYTKPLKTYENVNKAGMSGREVEARVLTKGALKLKACQDQWDTDDRDALLDEALMYNQRIWSIFQAELTRQDNPLPKQLKENLLNLSVFIDKRIFEVMAFPDFDKLTSIININNNIAAGLRGVPPPSE